MTEIDEQVDAVARAIHQERFGGQLVWGEQPDAEQECREEARAAIAAMPGWRTIESAPKDGTWIMVGAVNLHPCDAHWSWSAVADASDWMDGAGLFATPPTHWRPLPAPPKPEGA